MPETIYNIFLDVLRKTKVLDKINRIEVMLAICLVVPVYSFCYIESKRGADQMYLDRVERTLKEVSSSRRLTEDAFFLRMEKALYQVDNKLQTLLDRMDDLPSLTSSSSLSSHSSFFPTLVAQEQELRQEEEDYDVI